MDELIKHGLSHATLWRPNLSPEKFEKKNQFLPSEPFVLDRTIDYRTLQVNEDQDQEYVLNHLKIFARIELSLPRSE